MNAKAAALAGFHAVGAALAERPERLRVVWLDRRRQDTRLRELAAAATAAGVEVRLTDRARLDRLSDNARHQGVVAELSAAGDTVGDSIGDRRFGQHDLAELLANDPQPLLLVLDGVQDPHNLGACLRSAAAAGATAVIAPEHNAAGLTPAVRKVASGGAERVPLVKVSNLARCLRWLREQQVWLIGTAEEADSSLFDADLCGRCALLLGNEAKGLRPLTREHCDRLVRIPTDPQAPSLNVSVAAGVALFEAVRQRRRYADLAITTRPSS